MRSTLSQPTRQANCCHTCSLCQSRDRCALKPAQDLIPEGPCTKPSLAPFTLRTVKSRRRSGVDPTYLNVVERLGAGGARGFCHGARRHYFNGASRLYFNRARSSYFTNACPGRCRTHLIPSLSHPPLFLSGLPGESTPLGAPAADAHMVLGAQQPSAESGPCTGCRLAFGVDTALRAALEWSSSGWVRRGWELFSRIAKEAGALGVAREQDQVCSRAGRGCSF